MSRLLRGFPAKVTVLSIAVISVAWIGRHTERRQEIQEVKESRKNIDPQTSCGPVCLALVTEALGKHEWSITQFHEKSRAGDIGMCSMGELVRVLREEGFAAQAVRYEGNDLPDHTLPSILFLDGEHFVTALPVKGGQIVVLDPPNQLKVTTWSALRPRWSGEAVVAALNDDELSHALKSR